MRNAQEDLDKLGTFEEKNDAFDFMAEALSYWLKQHLQDRLEVTAHARLREWKSAQSGRYYSLDDQLLHIIGTDANNRVLSIFVGLDAEDENITVVGSPENPPTFGQLVDAALREWEQRYPGTA
jgi:hypothetical protein